MKKVINKTLTVRRTLTRTATVQSTLAVKPRATIVAFVFTDVNANGAFDSAVDFPAGGISVSLVRVGGGGARALVPEVLASGVSETNGSVVFYTLKIGPNDSLGIALSRSPESLLTSFKSDAKGNVPPGTVINAPVPLVATTTQSQTKSLTTSTNSFTASTSTSETRSSTSYTASTSVTQTLSSTSETLSSTSFTLTTTFTQTVTTSTKTAT